MIKKKFLTCALALLCVFCAVACSVDTVEPEDTEDTEVKTTSWTTSGKADEPMIKIVDAGKTDYRIVYSADADVWARHTAEYISDRIYRATGAAPKVTTDVSETVEHEIIIGSTNRDAEIGFDFEAHDWEIYPVHIGLYGNKILFASDKNIDIYENLSFAMDKWLEGDVTDVLGVNDRICQRMMKAAGSVSDNVITMLMQNVCTWGDVPNSRRERFERVYEEFRYYDADIVGVSEAIPQWIKYLDGVMLPDGYTRLGGKKLYAGLDGDWNNIYYKTEKFNVIEWDTFWYSETPDVPGSMYEGATDGKVATWAIFEVKTTGARFMVLNTHLHAYAKFGEIRNKQITQFTEFLKPYMSEYPVYIMGDMNIEESHSEYAKVLETFYDSRDVARENLSGEQDTYNAYGQREADADYIFTGKGKDQEILWYKVINEKRFGDYSIAANEWISDHYGVCVRTRIF